jgi:hypothetical protein
VDPYLKGSALISNILIFHGLLFMHQKSVITAKATSDVEHPQVTFIPVILDMADVGKF